MTRSCSRSWTSTRTKRRQEAHERAPHSTGVMGASKMSISASCDHPLEADTNSMRRHRCRATSSGQDHNRRPARLAALLAGVWLLAVACRRSEAQFLFTYEINQESDDSRAPKSSLFDPSSFKIVTPSQLQSSYQKLAGQPPEQAPLAPALTPASGPAAATSTQTPAAPPASASFLKQTSAAIQSFAELFNLGASPSPTLLGAGNGGGGALAAPIDQQAEARSLHEHWTQQQLKAHSPAAAQLPALQSFTTPASASGAQAQATSQSSSPASYWLTSSPLAGASDGNFLVEIKTPAPSAQQEEGARHTGHFDDNPQPPAGLTAREAPAAETRSSAAGGHFGLPALSLPASSPSPLYRAAATPSSLSAPAQSSFMSTPTSYYPTAGIQQTQTQAAVVHPHPQPQVVGEHNSFRPKSQQASPATSQFQHQTSGASQPQTQALHQHQARSLGAQTQQRQPQPQQQQQQQVASLAQFSADLLDNSPLQPPANEPREHQFDAEPPARFNQHQATTTMVAIPAQRQQAATSPQNSFKPLKSAEESLLAFRQQQQNQHDQQSAVLAAQRQLAAQQQTGAHSSAPQAPRDLGHRVSSGVALGAAGEPLELPVQPEQPEQNYNQLTAGEPLSAVSSPPSQKFGVGTQSPQSQQSSSSSPPAHHSQLGEIPKVSPQIYESFLLQQKDQYEKHMELLKQQQELNKLLEQKQREEAEKQKRKEKDKESQRSGKKEEQERAELRRKAARAEQEQQQQQLQIQAARKARQEAEEQRRRELLKQRQDEEDKRRRAAEEEQKYREFLEARRKQEADERRERERQQEEAELKRRREQQAAEEASRREREQYRNYVRQQEELKKLLELKQKEDEAIQAARRRQAAAAAATTTTTTVASTSAAAGPATTGEPARAVSSTQASRANRLAQEHRERVRQLGRHSSATGWGARGSATRARPTLADAPESTAGVPSLNELSRVSYAAPASSGAISASRAPLARSTTGGASGPGQQAAASSRKLKADEKLIRQKIPNYTGAGKYGLFRAAGNSSDPFADLVALLDSVTLPSSTTASSSGSGSTSTIATTTTTTSTSSTTPALPASSPDDLEPAEAPAVAQRRSSTVAEMMASSLSPLLNARELSVTPTPFAVYASSEPTSFDDDVPRRPTTRRLAASGQQAQVQVQPALQRRHGQLAAPASTNASRTAHIGLASLPADSDNDGIPGRAGLEYPVLAAVPSTSFSCAKQPLNGYYADTETACQVVHLCQGGVQSSILCPNGTIFNQEKFSCQWWYEVNCSRAPMFYQLNDNLYKPPAAADAADSPRSTIKDPVRLSEAALPAAPERKRARGTATSTNNL